MKLTQEQLAKLIAKVFSNLTAKFAEAGKNVNDITADDILAELSAVLEEMNAGEGEGAPAGDGEGKGEGEGAPAGEGEGEGDAEGKGLDGDELIGKIMEALSGVLATGDEGKAGCGTRRGDGKSGGAAAGEGKSATGPSASGAPKAAPQRKYASLFLSTGASRDGNGGSGFKARIASMSAPERRKAAYGMFGRAVKCIHASGGDIDRAAFTAERKFGDAEMAREFKALSVTSPTDGGYLVPEVYANEIIELLYPATVIYSLGARRLGMANGNLNIPKIKTGSRAMFTGENRAIPKSAPKFGNLKLSAKKLTALIPMSNDLLRSTNFDNDVIVGQDVTKQMALGVDWGALNGTGGEFQPLGITKNKGVQNIDVTALDELYASSAGVLTAAFPNYLIASVLKNNVYADGLGFVFNTSVEQFFKSLRDNVGGFIFAQEMNENGTLAGYPYRTTNLLETASGKTSIIFGNWNDLVIGEQGALEIETSRGGAWTDDAGHLVSAFENDQTLIRAINNVDTGLRHDESFAVATKVAVPV